MTPLTDADIERIARSYCREMGLDPDKEYWFANVVAGKPMRTWEGYADEVRDRLAWKIALQGFGDE